MGLKENGETDGEQSTAGIKSDQNGIERFLVNFNAILYTFFLIKSDQNGIERARGV